MVSAYKAIEEFDGHIGQVISTSKTTVFNHYKKRSEYFLLKVGRRLKHAAQVKSLGFSHVASKKKSAQSQDARVSKAKVVARKVAHLPLNQRDKAIHIHSNVHSKWVYGSETQAPSKKALASLRTAVANVFVKRRNHMRCPFLLFLSHSDPFLDPFGKWVHHVFTKLRKLSWSHPHTVRKILQAAKQRKSNRSRTANGISNVVAFLCSELQWDIEDVEGFVFSRHGDAPLCLQCGSQDFFRECLATSVRCYLFRNAPDRYENPSTERTGTPDVFLTRFLLDESFSKKESFSFLQKHLSSLPASFDYIRNVLRFLHSGSLYTGPRLQSAKLQSHERCIKCSSRETHQHLFCECSGYAELRPDRGSEPNMSWFTGIMFEPPGIVASRVNAATQPITLPAGERYHVDGPVFVMGHVFSSVGVL